MRIRIRQIPIETLTPGEPYLTVAVAGKAGDVSSVQMGPAVLEYQETPLDLKWYPATLEKL